MARLSRSVLSGHNGPISGPINPARYNFVTKVLDSALTSVYYYTQQRYPWSKEQAIRIHPRPTGKTVAGERGQETGKKD
jgi:hypothetical protein